MPKATARKVTGKTSGEVETDQFRAGDVWESPRGVRHSVIRVSASGVAYMINENTQRTALRAWDDLGWGTDRPWVRVLSVAEKKS